MPAFAGKGKKLDGLFEECFQRYLQTSMSYQALLTQSVLKMLLS